LPRNASGKVMWRTLQAEQDARDHKQQDAEQSATDSAAPAA
jgi:acyl-coenzyme A synthetase/AMP-(fatty) acid ligase